MPGAEGLDGGSPEIRPHADQAPVSQGYDPEFEQRVDETMRRSGMRLTRTEATEYVENVDAYVDRVAQRIAELRDENTGTSELE